MRIYWQCSLTDAPNLILYGTLRRLYAQREQPEVQLDWFETLDNGKGDIRAVLFSTAQSVSNINKLRFLEQKYALQRVK